MRVRAHIATFLGLLSAIMLSPGGALACPVCAADNNARTLKIAMVLMAVPFVIVGVMIRVIRQVQQRADDSGGELEPTSQ